MVHIEGRPNQFSPGRGSADEKKGLEAPNYLHGILPDATNCHSSPSIETPSFHV
jgi:hypothetical protein